MATKKVRMKVSIAAVDFSYAPGQIVEIDAEAADKWCDSGLAEPVVDEADDHKPKKPAAKRNKKAGDEDGAETADTADDRADHAE